jgi:hypothetical protein
MDGSFSVKLMDIAQSVKKTRASREGEKEEW